MGVSNQASGGRIELHGCGDKTNGERTGMDDVHVQGEEAGNGSVLGLGRNGKYNDANIPQKY